MDSFFVRVLKTHGRMSQEKTKFLLLNNSGMACSDYYFECDIASFSELNGAHMHASYVSGSRGLNRRITFKFDPRSNEFIGWLDDTPDDQFIITPVYDDDYAIAGMDIHLAGDPFVAHFTLPRTVHVYEDVDEFREPLESVDFVELSTVRF